MTELQKITIDALCISCWVCICIAVIGVVTIVCINIVKIIRERKKKDGKAVSDGKAD